MRLRRRLRCGIMELYKLFVLVSCRNFVSISNLSKLHVLEYLQEIPNPINFYFPLVGMVWLTWNRRIHCIFVAFCI